MGKFLNFIGLEETEEEDVLKDEQPVEQPKPAETVKPVEQPKPAETVKPVEQPKPAESAGPAAQEQSAAENIPETVQPEPPKQPAAFDEEEELNYAQRVKRELEEARKKSVLGDPRVKLPPIPEEPEPAPEKPKKKRKKRELTPEELEQKLRAKETPEETKARHRASLLDDLPELPEERPPKRREKETPEQTKARRRAELLDDLPDVDDMQKQRSAEPLPGQEPDIPKLDAGMGGTISVAETDEDPFKDADIHWNNDQTTFTIRL